MKIRMRELVLVLLVLGGSLAGCGGESSDWSNAIEANDPATFEKFLSQYPDGEHAVEAQQRLTVLLEEQAWAKVSDSPGIKSLEEFLERFPAGAHVAEATAKLAPLRAELEAAVREEAKQLHGKYAVYYPQKAPYSHGTYRFHMGQESQEMFNTWMDNEGLFMISSSGRETGNQFFGGTVGDGYKKPGTREQDPWQNRYVFESIEGKTRVISSGPDGVFGTEDDISWP